MPTLTSLTLYPIKSCAGIALSEATLTEAGLMSEHIYNREWMVVDAAGNFLTQREHPRMATIVPRLRGEVLELRAPGMLRLDIPLDLPAPEDARTIAVRVWQDTVDAYDCDELTATWFSKALGTPCRLVRFHPDARRVASLDWTGGVEAPVMFADGFPLLVIAQASLDDLNERMRAAGRAPLTMDRFRPSLVIDGVAAFDEDYAAAIRIGDAAIRPVKPCPRCPIPSVDQATGVVGPDPLDILRGYRVNPKVDGGITFGMNAIVTAGAGQLLKVGQEVELELAL
ncbi:MAG: MOSC N-terminal beta barrel domain-containing protein [Burkholderiaceae bacterium]